MQEYDLIRLLIYGCSMMIMIVTGIKLIKLRGIIGSSIRLNGIGLFLISVSLLSHLLYSIFELQDPIWSPILELLILIILTIGIGLAILGLWRIILFFDELNNEVKLHNLNLKVEKSSTDR